MVGCFKSKINVISSVLIAALILTALPWRGLSADSNTHGEYNAFPFDISYEQNSTWNNSTQGQFTITNTSSEAVTQWRLEIVYDSDVTITNIWDATDVTDYDNDDIITISGSSRISSGGTYTFGLIAEGNDSAPVAPIDVNTVQFISEEPTPTPTPTNTPTPTPTTEPTTEPTVTNTPTPTPAEEDDVVFPYAIFAGSTSDDFSFQGWKSNIVGDIYSGRNFLYQGSELNMEGYARTVGAVQPSGWKTNMTGSQEHIDPIDIPDWSASILAKSSQLPAIDQTSFSSQNSIVANGYYYTDGNLTINSTLFTGDAIIAAKGNITYNVNALSGTGRVLLYSEEGNITINGTEIEINGILYAPQGRVSINAYNTTINGRIVADKFSYNGSILNVTADPSDLQLVSELPDVTVTASRSQVNVGQTAYYTIEIPEDNVYEILYRLNGTSVEVTIPENEEEPIRYDLNTNTAGTYTLEAYISLPYGTFVLDSDTITVVAQPTATPTNTPTPTIEPTEAPTPTPTDVPDYSIDTDEDYLPDAYELEIGTDPNNPDSDFDDIPDGIELAIGYDPNEPDSDGDLIDDGDEDFDGDGLSNRVELTIDTILAQRDSDYDEIEDGEEISNYHTDPTKKDTDGDKIFDGDEVAIGKDPTDPSDGKTRVSQTLKEIIRNDEDAFVTRVDVNVSLANRAKRVLTIEDLYNQDVYTTDLVGRKGSPVGLECEESFSTATIVFHYDDSKLGDTREDDLGVLWYDEEHGLYITQEQAVIDKAKNTITLEVSHFSTYVIADLEIWNNIEPVHYDIPTKEKTFDYILVFDKSSAVTADQRYQACELAFDLLGHMKQGDRATYGFFTTDYNVTLQGQVSDYAGRDDLLDNLNWNLTRGQLPGTYGSYEQALKAGKTLSEQLVSSLGETDNEKQLFIITSDKDEGYRPGIYAGDA